jgi:hypothetical protein
MIVRFRASLQRMRKATTIARSASGVLGDNPEQMRKERKAEWQEMHRQATTVVEARFGIGHK